MTRHTQPFSERARFWADTRQAVGAPVRALSLATVCGVVVVAVEDWFVYPGQLAYLWSVKSVLVAAQLAVVWLVGTRWGRQWIESIAVTGALATIWAGVPHVPVLREAFLVPMAASVVCYVSATVLPWRLRDQLRLVAGSVPALLAANWLLRGSPFRLDHQAVAALALCVASIPLARHVQDRRLDLWRSQRALRESEERFREVAENSEDIVWIFSPGRRIQYVSPAFERVTGRPARSLYENPYTVLEIVHPDDSLAFGVALEAVLAGDSRKMDLRMRRADGSEARFEGWGAPVRDESGKVVRCIGIWRDVTDRVRLVEDLDAYAHVVAHDLKTPITVIAGYVDALRTNPENLDPRARALLERVSHGCRKMTQIINELLLLASVRHREVVEITPLDMADIVREALQRLAPLVEAAEIVLPESWPEARGHAPWLEEVWANYVTNAIKYGGEPPRVELGATPTPDSTTRFWVRDNGPGLSPEQRQRLFREFTRLEPVAGTGHGLGLSIVQRIVETLGGTVGVDSAQGEGSTFWFTLPS